MIYEVEYYDPNSALIKNGEWDDNWLAALSDVIVEFVGLLNSGVTSVSAKFATSSGLSFSNNFLTSEVYLNLGLTDDGRIKIGQQIYLPSELVIVNGLLNASITSAASIYIMGQVGIALNTPFVPAEILAASVFSIGVSTAAGVGYGYSKFLNPTISQTLDFLNGTVDARVVLKSHDGAEVLGGLYKDGFPSGDEANWTAINDLIVKSLTSSYPDAMQGMTVEVSRMREVNGQIVPVSEEYYIYDGSIASRGAELFFGGDIEAFNNFDGGTGNVNGRLYSEYEVNGVTHRWITARDPLQDFPEIGPQDNVRIPLNDGLNATQEFHPRNIYIAEGDGHFVVTSSTDDQPRLYLGDSADSTSVFAAHAGIGDDRMYGGGGDDALYGDVGDDRIYGDFGAQASEQAYAYHYGDDDLYGEDGDDYLFGGAGNDMLDGGEDDDVLSGQDGLDMLIGGAGNDVLDGGAGLDSLDGGSGNDFLVGGTGNNTLNGGTETIPYGPVPVENLDHIAMDRALANGDTVDYSWVEDGQGIHANLSDTARVFGSETLSAHQVRIFDNAGTISTDTVLDIENIFDTQNSDLIIGDDSENVFRYSGGNDVYYGGDDAGDSFFVNRPGSDETVVIHGEGGLDRIFILDDVRNYHISYDAVSGIATYRNTNNNGKIIVQSEDHTDIVTFHTNVVEDLASTVVVRQPGNFIYNFTNGPTYTSNLIDIRGAASSSAPHAYEMPVSYEVVRHTAGSGGGMSGAELEIILRYLNGDQGTCVLGLEDNTFITFNGVPILAKEGEAVLNLTGLTPVTSDIGSFSDLSGIAGFKPNGNLLETYLGSDADRYFIDGDLPFVDADANSASFIQYDVVMPVETGVYAAFGEAERIGSPLVLDIDGDGIELVSQAQSTVFWDIDADGYAEKSGWVGADDGLLAIDLNNDGVISTHEELFGNLNTDGFTDLSNFDSNNDNLITAADEQFADLLVWQDVNQNGISSSSELFTLSELNIVSINLNASTPYNMSIEGNKISHVSTYTVNDGVHGAQQHSIVDAWFSYSNIDTLYDQNFNLDHRTFDLPNIRGYGIMPSIQIAASIDNDTNNPESLLSLLQSFAAKGLEDIFVDDRSVFDEVTAIMYRWAGVDSIDPNSRNSRGGDIDARKIEFLEKLLGEDYLQQNGYSDPAMLAGDALEKAFETALYPIAGRLIAQGAGAALFNDGAYYNPVTDKFEGFTGFNQSALDALLDLSLDGHQVADKSAFWLNVINTIDQALDVATLSAANLSVLQNTLSASDASLTVQMLIDEVVQNINEVYTGSTGENWNGTSSDETHTGYVGNDYINGGYGNDTLYGGIGNDNIDGGFGNDILNGQLGDDNLQGGGGADIYKYDLGQGNDTILEGGSDLDTLEFGAGITFADLEIARTLNGGVKISINPDVGAGSVTISGNVEYLKFADTTQVDIRTLNQTLRGTSGNDSLVGMVAGAMGTGADTIYGEDGNDTIYANAPNENDYNNNFLYGGSGNDTLYGSFGSDYLDGGAGNDILQGGAGNDIYAFSYGEGNDTYTEYSGTDKIVFGAGITQSMLNIYRINNFDVKIDINNGLGGSITIKNQTYNTGYVIETQELADGSTDAFGNISYALHGTSDSDTLNGTNYGGSGIDFIYGHAGNDIISGYYTSSDTNTNYLYGGDGNDTIIGASGIDYLQGDAGNDTISGGAGNDVFTFNYGDGNDTYDDTSGTEKIVFGAGVTQSMLNIYRTSTFDMKIDIDGGLGGSITLKNQNYGTTNAIEVAEFNDGSTLQLTNLNLTLQGSAASEYLYGTNYISSGIDTIYGNDGNDVINGCYFFVDYASNYLYGGNGNDAITGAYGADYLYGESGNDTLTGGYGDDTLSGGAGADILNGDSGNDIYIFQYGDGVDTVVEAGGTDKIVFGAGITQSMLNIYRTSTFDVKIDIDGGLGGSVILQSQNYNSLYSTEVAEFNDGSTLQLSNLNLTLQGSSASEYLYGTNYGSSGSDTIYGNDGNDIISGCYHFVDSSTDYLYGGNGNDTIHAANGTDYLYGEADNDTLKGGAGNDFLYGGSGVDYLEGNDGNDTLYGGDGADTLKGSSGTDTFVFQSMSDAGDVIQDYNYSAFEKIDISDLLAEYDPLTEVITDFVQITQSGTNSILSIDVDGGANSFVQLATLSSTSGLTDEAALVASGRLIVV